MRSQRTIRFFSLMRVSIQNYTSIVALVLVFGTTAVAQKKKKEKPIPDREATALLYSPSIDVDGNLSDWGDFLRFSYEKQHLQFDIANDGTNLYIAMKTSDPDAEMQALRQGFSFMINVDGKKKAGATVTFPLPDREALRSLMALPDEEKPKDIRAGMLATVKAIYVNGFKDMVDGPISLENDYGIRARVGIDTLKDALSYEAQIPISRLYLNTGDDSPLAMNIKINGTIIRMVGDGNMNPYGVGRQRYGGYYGSPYYGNTGSNMPMRREAREEPGKWVVLPLAKKN